MRWIVIILVLCFCSCVNQYHVFHVNRKFSGEVEYIFMKGRKSITVKTDTMPYKKNELITLRQIKKLEK
jgi:hypothetical protein